MLVVESLRVSFTGGLTCGVVAVRIMWTMSEGHDSIGQVVERILGGERIRPLGDFFFHRSHLVF